MGDGILNFFSVEKVPTFAYDQCETMFCWYVCNDNNCVYMLPDSVAKVILSSLWCHVWMVRKVLVNNFQWKHTCTCICLWRLDRKDNQGLSWALILYWSQYYPCRTFKRNFLLSIRLVFTHLLKSESQRESENLRSSASFLRFLSPSLSLALCEPFKVYLCVYVVFVFVASAAKPLLRFPYKQVFNMYRPLHHRNLLDFACWKTTAGSQIYTCIYVQDVLK